MERSGVGLGVWLGRVCWVGWGCVGVVWGGVGLGWRRGGVGWCWAWGWGGLWVERGGVGYACALVRRALLEWLHAAIKAAKRLSKHLPRKQSPAVCRTARPAQLKQGLQHQPKLTGFG